MTAACPPAPIRLWGLRSRNRRRPVSRCKWNLEDDVHAYRVEYRVAGSEDWTELAGGAGGASEFIDTTIYTRKVTPLVCNTEYDFRVSARGRRLALFDFGWGTRRHGLGQDGCVPGGPG